MSEEGEFSDAGKHSDNESDESSRTSSRGDAVSHKAKPKKKKSRYSELASRFDKLEALVTKAFASKVPETNSAVITTRATEHLETNSRVAHASDTLSLCADSDNFDSDENCDPHKESSCSDSSRKCLYDIFGEDSIVKKKTGKEGIILDKSQIEVIENSYRCSEPNFLTAFSEENVDLFPLDEECENFLKVPSLDPLVDCCLVKRYGSKASFARSKGKVLYSQPCKMVDKICFKGQHAARLGIIMQCYVQQSLGNLLQFLESDSFDKEMAAKQVKGIFSMSTKVLDQVGRAGALHHISRRTVAMSDTGLYEQHDNLEFANLPLSGEGVFGKNLETLLKDRKEKKKQVDDLIPDVQRHKRKFSGQSDFSKKSNGNEKTPEKSASGQWNSFRIPRVQQRTPDNRGYGRGRGSFRNQSRRQPASSGKSQLDKPVDK